METVSISIDRRIFYWLMYLLTGASYALLVVVIVVFPLFFLLHLTTRNLFLVLYLVNILLSILPGLSSNSRQLKEFLIFSFIGSLLCSTVGLIVIDWQTGWYGVSFSILFVFLASLEFSLVASITHIIRVKLKKKK